MCSPDEATAGAAFRSEIAALGSIRHRNIVRLLGWARGQRRQQHRPAAVLQLPAQRQPERPPPRWQSRHRQGLARGRRLGRGRALRRRRVGRGPRLRSSCPSARRLLPRPRRVLRVEEASSIDDSSPSPRASPLPTATWHKARKHLPRT
jgi:hypothetical protein